MTNTNAIQPAIAKLVERRDLTDVEMAGCMRELFTGSVTPSQFGAFVTALRMKGETAEEIAAVVQALQQQSHQVHVDGPLLDTCGTGGDSSGSFNVSTAAAFVAAGAGARVAKHGNRAMTSQCGSADVLEALGARIDLTAADVARCIEQTGIGFMFAQAFHPAMKEIAPLRREIGVRTVFNLAAPLANPAGASHRMLGVATPQLLELMPAVLQRLGVERGLVVHGDEGLDELSISGPSTIARFDDGAITTARITPEDAGLERHEASAVKGGSPDDNSRSLRAVLAGEAGGEPAALRDFTLLNAGAALVAWGAAADVRSGVDLARKSIDSGAAAAKLDAFIAATNESTAP